MWVLKWAELLQIRSSNARQLQGDAALLQLAARQDRQQRAGQRVGAGAARRQRRHVQEPGHQLLPERDRHPQDRPRTSPRCSWACASSAPSATTTRSTAGRMDDYYGFAAFFSQIGRKGTDDPRETIVFNSGGGEVTHPVARPRDEAEVPRRGRAGRGRQGPPRGAGAVAGVAGQPVFRRQPGQHRLGPLLRHGHHRPRGRRARQQPGLQPGVAGRAGQALHRIQIRLQEAGPRHLHFADVPARRRRPTTATRATRATSPTPSCGASRPRRSSTASARRRTPRTSSPACRWGRGRCRSPTAASAPTS